jgi:hypothetical protein
LPPDASHPDPPSLTRLGAKCPRLHPPAPAPEPCKADDATWTEVRNFQKCLLQMAMASGREVIFMETAMRLTGGRAHAVMEAVFVSPEVGGAWGRGRGPLWAGSNPPCERASAAGGARELGDVRRFQGLDAPGPPMRADCFSAALTLSTSLHLSP